MAINDNTYTIGPGIYSVATPGVYTVAAGTTINDQTFASSGVYTIMPTYTSSTNTYPRVSVTWGRDTPQSIQSKETSLNVDKLIESLFRLNPTAKKKFKGDGAKFAAAIVAAAEALEQQKALATLSDLGLAE